MIGVTVLVVQLGGPRYKRRGGGKCDMDEARLKYSPHGGTPQRQWKRDGPRTPPWACVHLFVLKRDIHASALNIGQVISWQTRALTAPKGREQL